MGVLAAPDASTIDLRAPLADLAPPAGGGTAAVSDIPPERLRWHVPDPEAERPVALELLAKAERDGDKTQAGQIRRVLARVGEIRRENQIHLTLEEVLRRTLENSYAIQIISYNPAIETTRVVEAEAAFDAVFFTNIIKNKIDRPSGNELVSTNLDLFTSDYGIRKLLPTGMTTSMAYSLNRTKSAISFQQINPEYTSNFIFEMRQPLLRGFGIDYNRSIILLTQNDRRIGDHAFRRQIRDTLRQVEEFYWRLVQARRDIVITARLLGEYETIYDYLDARKEFDITPVQLAATRANLEQSKFEFIRRKAAVFDAEDQLTAAMNWDKVNLADDLEIIPDDSPKMARIVVDRLAEVQTALDYRPEIKEQELRVANAQIAVGRAKNEELPRFDLTFRQTYDGLAGNADKSFDELTRANYIEYFIGVEFEVPIGNRGPRAAHKRSRLQHAQQVAALKQVFEEVILDVNVATRALTTSYDQILPSFEAAEAREREVSLAVARAERKDYNTLSNELGARQSLANARRAMIISMVDYNIAIIDLERAKGTLLTYNNVVIPEQVP
jgi:outer membrane protein TolC